MRLHFFISVLATLSVGSTLAAVPAPAGFPPNWKGDQYFQSTCPVSKNFPSWLDGFFFCQTSASYGKQTNPVGQKIVNLFDAVSALALFDINPKRSTFSGRYYPTKQQKMWNFYGRDMSQSKVGWFTQFTPFNLTQYKKWYPINDGLSTMNPNVDFWKVGNQIISATEAKTVGYTYNVSTLANFHLFPFKDSSPFMTSTKKYGSYSMPVHERKGPSGSIYASAIVADTSKVRTTGTGNYYQLVFNVKPDGTRTVLANYTYPTFNLSHCDPTTKKYTGPVSQVGSYMHSVTSTKDFVILPMTSVVFNPCVMKFGYISPAAYSADLINPLNASQMTPFIYYEKNLPLSSAKFVTHQWNAYQTSSTQMVADMITYDYDALDTLYVDRLLHPEKYTLAGTARRFTIDISNKKLTSALLLPPETNNIEYPQFNHNFEGQKYQWGYVLHGWYSGGSEIWKINMNDPTGKQNSKFSPGNNYALTEPWFIQSPHGTAEDDGVVMVRALDISINKSAVFVVDAKTMQQLGKLSAPTVVPFGYHNRYYSRKSLGMQPTNKIPARSPVPQGFPAAWNGDRYFQSKCHSAQASNSYPQWIDGFFFAQTCGSYGNQSNPMGQKILHMFDAISGMALFDVNPKQTLFTGRYYPTRLKTIWDFYQRDMTQSKVFWRTGFTPYNQTQANTWNSYQSQMFPFGPDVDFWKIGNSIVAATEYFGVGLTFDIPNANNYRPYPFKDNAQVFLNPGGIIQPLNMPVHTRYEPDGSQYASISAVNTTGFKANKTTGNFIQYIFKVKTDGTRTIEGGYSFPQFDLKNCNTTTYKYQGSLDALPGYMHSITSTTDTIILPITSVVIDPCFMLFKGPNKAAVIVDPRDPSQIPPGEYYRNDVPLRFLVFSKSQKTFLTPSPINYATPRWISHQWNAYKLQNGNIVADMITYDHNVYQDLYVHTLLDTSQKHLKGAAWRFTINLSTQTVASSNLMPPEYDQIEFSQFNHLYEGKPYNFGYVLRYPYLAGSQIVKMNMGDNTGNSYKFFTAGPRVALAEPWFVAQPGTAALQEDLGVLFVRGLDLDMNKAILYIVDAQSMQLVYSSVAPASVPFGFHNRFYTREELGMKPTIQTTTNAQVTTKKTPVTSQKPTSGPVTSQAATSKMTSAAKTAPPTTAKKMSPPSRTVSWTIILFFAASVLLKNN